MKNLTVTVFNAFYPGAEAVTVPVNTAEEIAAARLLMAADRIDSLPLHVDGIRDGRHLSVSDVEDPLYGGRFTYPYPYPFEVRA